MGEVGNCAVDAEDGGAVICEEEPGKGSLRGDLC